MLYAEDLIVGQRFEFGSYTIGEEEILRFARQYDPVPIHIDKEAAASGPFGGLIASGFNTLARVGRTCGFAVRSPFLTRSKHQHWMASWFVLCGGDFQSCQ